jgi:phenylpropionate dioxygenase-like ring-hydroxylating dioxygenase large terminal subunit
MRKERQIELLERVGASGPRMVGLHQSTSMINDAASYTDPARLEDERRELFRGGPTFFALSCELVGPGSYRSATVGGVPIVVTRQADGTVRAHVNACRHRAAPLVAPDTSGTGLRAFSCPYHSWTYELDGRLRARPMAAEAFDDVTINCDLHPRAVAEKYGMIFVRAGGIEPIDVDAFLSGAEDDLGAFGLESYVHLESRTNVWNMNWKLILDTFSESYHIRTLHRDSIAPAFNSDCVIFEGFGPHLVSVGLRNNVLDELEKPRDEWSLIPYGTIQYFLVPNALVVHQLDHVEIWRVEPIDVGTTRTVTSIYAPGPEVSEKAERYFIKNLDLLLSVTGTEDFPMMEQIYDALSSGALPQLVYGKNEGPLIHFHSSINAAVAGATGRP